MFLSCVIVNIPLATGNKLNCFISAGEMLSIILPCALMLLLFCFVLFFVDFYVLINHILEKKNSNLIDFCYKMYYKSQNTN